MEQYSILQSNLVDAIASTDTEPNIPNQLNLNWIGKVPRNRANQLFSILGQPDRLDANPGGFVRWKNIDPFFRTIGNPEFTADKLGLSTERIKMEGVYSELLVKDEEIPHVVPAPHLDCFYAKIYLDIPDCKVKSVLDLTESVGYDTMTRELYARCHFMPANLTSLYLCKQIARGHKGLAHAQQEYVALISVLAMEEKKGRGLLSKNLGLWHRALTNYLFDLNI